MKQLKINLFAILAINVLFFCPALIAHFNIIWLCFVVFYDILGVAAYVDSYNNRKNNKMI